MDRIEQIKCVFQDRPFDKTSFPVIHADRDECQTGYPTAAQHAGAGNGLEYALIPKSARRKTDVARSVSKLTASSLGECS